MTDFDWNDLRTFLAVVRTGKLTAAARRLGADHTTVARRISALETALKVKLFDRLPTGYSLTVHGEKLVAAAEAMESVAIIAQSEITEAEMGIAGVVRIGTPDGFGSAFLAPRIGTLCKKHPDLEVQLIAIPWVFSLSKREADLAVCLNPPKEGRLVCTKLTDYRLQLYAAPAYLAQHPPIKNRDDLPKHRFIGYIDDLIYAPELDYLREVCEGIIPQIKSSTLVAQLKATQAGAGICVLPSFMAVEAPDLVPILHEEISLTRSYWLMTHADQRDVARIRAVARFMTEEVRRNRGLFMPDQTAELTDALKS